MQIAHLTSTDHIHTQTLEITTSNYVALIKCILIIICLLYRNLHSKMRRCIGSGFILLGSNPSIANNYLCVLGQVIQHLQATVTLCTNWVF